MHWFWPMSPTDDHILFITLDSCRFNTFAESRVPSLKAIAPFIRRSYPAISRTARTRPCLSASRPASRAAPRRFSIQNLASFSSLSAWGIPAKGPRDMHFRAAISLKASISLVYKTIGTAAMTWFDPSIITGAHLTDSSSHFFYASPYFLDTQTRFVNEWMIWDRPRFSSLLK